MLVQVKSILFNTALAQDCGSSKGLINTCCSLGCKSSIPGTSCEKNWDPRVFFVLHGTERLRAADLRRNNLFYGQCEPDKNVRRLFLQSSSCPRSEFFHVENGGYADTRKLYHQFTAQNELSKHSTGWKTPTPFIKTIVPQDTIEFH